MIKTIAAFITTLVTMLAFDMLWIGVVAQSLYQNGIGHLLAARPNLPVAVLFYLVFAGGLTAFAVVRRGAQAGWRKTLLAAALYGFFTYATYDLTNFATLRDWPLDVTVLDMLWGPLLCTLAAAAGKTVWDRFQTS